MYTLSLAVKSMCCKKADYMHTNLSSLYTTGCSIATSACKAKKVFASLVQPMYCVGKSNINFEYQMYSYIGFLNIIDQKSKAEGLRLFLLNCDQPKLGGICPPPSVPTALCKYSLYFVVCIAFRFRLQCILFSMCACCQMSTAQLCIA